MRSPVHITIHHTGKLPASAKDKYLQGHRITNSRRTNCRQAAWIKIGILVVALFQIVPLLAQSPESTPNWQARHHYWLARQMSSDGSGPNAQAYWQAWNDLQKMRGGTDQLSMQGEAWSPIGPYGPVPHENSLHISGVGRINCITFHPSNARTFWVGVGQGGVWGTRDGGQSWMPLNQGLPILRVSDIAVDPRNPDIMYVSLGDYAYIGVDLEHQNRKRHTHFGMGVYKSVDAGMSWAPTGLTFFTEEGDGTLIRRVLIDPRDSHRLTALGASGIFHSRDAGKSWSNGAVEELIWDVELNPQDSAEIYISTGYLAAQGIGHARILKSIDYGQSWQRLQTFAWGHDRQMQRIEIAVAPSRPERVYAIACDLQSKFYGLLRSDNAGADWESLNVSPYNILGGFTGDSSDVRGQGAYDLYLLVDQQDHDCLYAGGINSWKSEDAGENFQQVSYWRRNYGTSVHADHHFLAFNQLDRKFYLCHDGGLDRTAEIVAGFDPDGNGHGANVWATEWENLSAGLAITSFYRLGVNPSDDRYLIAGAQDNATFIRRADMQWHNVFGGDGMDCQFGVQDDETVFGSTQYAQVVYYSKDAGRTASLNFSDLNGPLDFGEWVTPIEVVHGDEDQIIVAQREIYKRRASGDSLLRVPISNFGTDIFELAPTTAMGLCRDKPDVIYIAKRPNYATNTGISVFATFNGGEVWTDISIGLPSFLYVTDLEVHPQNPLIAWLTFGGYDQGQKIYETRDGGSSWENISSNLPNVPLNCVVRDSSSTDNDIYVGADLGIYVRNDLNPDWTLYNRNLPNVIVADLAVHTNTQTLYAATFGRGIWKAPLADVNVISSIDADSENGPFSHPKLAPRIYPNPAREFTVDIPEAFLQSGACTFEIVDVSGRINQAGTMTMQRNKLRLPAGSGSGVYFLRLQGSGLRAALRFVFTH